MAAAKANGKSVGRLVDSVEDANKFNEEGCDFICYSGDIWLYHNALRDGLTAVRAAIES